MTTSAKWKVPFVDLKAQFASIQSEIADSIDRVLHSAQFIGGDWVERFEEQFARSVGARFAVGVSSGTAALELSLKCLQIGQGDEVVVPANTFFATAEAVSNVGATPVFADVDRETFHLNVDCVERVTTARTRAVIAVHLYGRAMDMTALQEFAEAKRLLIIEDAAQAHGDQRGGIPVGGSGRLTCFSFYPGKNLGAYGDAGAVTCNDAHQAEQLRLLSDHGSPAKYVHSIIGTNSRLDGIQAAVLSIKLPHLSEWNSRRVSHAKSYADKLNGSSVQIAPMPLIGEHNFHLFVVRVAYRDDLKEHLQQRGIEAGIHYPIPLHLTAAYQQMGYPGRGSLPVAEALSGEILSLPMYPELTESQIDYVTTAILDRVSTSSAEGAETYEYARP
jgi:dTDP-3-amino-3,4,6-trideoxy-alpha-D-glucose transaminase